ncbi:MAG: hypothetical protein EOP85_16785 [Verrucomicrobiaceae bacterium]|nr:MAG: hypothetical protein EOP85_16785 [Verrucomicrobiaceae bacterium]
MSWFQTNYEKAALGGAAVIALGLAFAGWSKFGGIPEEFGTVLKGTGNNNSAVKDADLISKANSSFKLERTWTKEKVDGDRAVDLFTGIPLYVKSSSPEEQVDPIKDEPVHPPIPNTWWIEHRLDMGFADSPQRDPDSDGFSNLEEFQSKTDPNDPKSVPALIAKLKYVKDESLGWVLRPGYGEGSNFPFNYEDTKGGVNKVGAADMIEPGGLFFSKGVMANRFKLLGSEVRKEMNTKVNIEMEVTIVRIEDQRANKKGTIYEIPSPLSDLRKNEYLKYDRTAVLSLEALGMEGKEFKVEENTTFALPPGAASKDYTVKTVTPDAITVEYPTPSGEKKTVQITKGNTATMTE